MAQLVIPPRTPRPSHRDLSSPPPSDQATPSQRRFATVLWAAVSALILTYLAAFTLSAVIRLPRPVEYMYGESIVLEIARRVGHGEPLYPAPDRLPLTVTAYTPLYYLLVGTLQRVFGESYVPGRLLSLASTLGAAGALAWSIRRVSGCWRSGLLAAGLFLTQNMTATLWAPLHRVDLLALCFTLVGLALATAGRPGAAILPLLLAVLTKQTYFVAPLAVGAALWPDRRAVLGFALPFAAGLALAIAAVQVLSGGWFLWHAVVANINPFDLEYLWAIVGQFLQFNALPLLAAAGLFALPTRPRERLWRLYFLGSLLMLPSLGKVGASSNYWLELTAATAALVAVLATRLPFRAGERAAFSRAGLAVLLLCSLLVTMPGYQAVVGEALHVLPAGGTGAIKAQADAAPFVAAQSGAVLTDEPGLAVAAGVPVNFEFRIFQLLADGGLWDERPILEAIESRHFDLVVVTRSLDGSPVGGDIRWSTRVRDALRDHYDPAGQRDGYHLYLPRRAAAAAP